MIRPFRPRSLPTCPISTLPGVSLLLPVPSLLPRRSQCWTGEHVETFDLALVFLFSIEKENPYMAGRTRSASTAGYWGPFNEVAVSNLRPVPVTKSWCFLLLPGP